MTPLDIHVLYRCLYGYDHNIITTSSLVPVNAGYEAKQQVS